MIPMQRGTSLCGECGEKMVPIETPDDTVLECPSHPREYFGAPNISRNTRATVHDEEPAGVIVDEDGDCFMSVDYGYRGVR